MTETCRYLTCPNGSVQHEWRGSSIERDEGVRDEHHEDGLQRLPGDGHAAR